MIPGVPDALGARLAERAGFRAVFLSGYAASASLLGGSGRWTVDDDGDGGVRAACRGCG
jgi:hypothetical protein